MPDSPQPIFAFFAIQIARIKAKLIPQPIHSSGPRRPDLADQEDKDA